MYSGSESNVYDTFNPSIVAKEMTSLHEYNLLSKLNHPNIIKPLGYYEKNGLYYMLLPRLFPLSPVTVEQLREVVEAIHYINSLGVYHNDLHEGNIMEKDGKLYLIDFGSARQGEWNSLEDDLYLFSYSLLNEMIRNRNPDLDQLDIQKFYVHHFKNHFKSYGPVGTYLFQFLK